MHRRSRSTDRKQALYLILPTIVACGGAPPATHRVEQRRDDGASARSEAGAPTDPGRSSELPGAPDACESARAELRGPGASSFESNIQSARAQAGELRAAGFGERSERAAELLRRLALALASAPEAEATDATRICEVTQQADALESREDKPFQGSAQIKRALSSVVALLEEHAERAAIARLRLWLDAARRAVQSIDEQGMVAFQGSEIQDAFRTTVDALTVLGRREDSLQ